MRSERRSSSRSRRTSFVAALLLYQFAFFNIFLPGHTRGCVTMDGRSTGGCPMCCSSCCASASTHSTDPKHAPSDGDREQCAICSFAAHAAAPPAVVWTLPELGLLKLLPLPPPTQAVSVSPLLTYLGRAPPVSM